jgi:hypothetical protein
VNITRTSSDAWPANGPGWGLDKITDDRCAGTPSATVIPLCREFRAEDAAYTKWADTHPQGFVLNQRGAANSKAPTLHRVGCAAVAPRPGTDTSMAGSIRVCGPNATALEAWSVAHGTGTPSACGRCRP